MRRTILALLLPLCSFPAFAQENEAANASARSAWFIYTQLPEEVENPVKVIAGREIKELTLSKRSVSGPVKIPADGILRLVKEMPHPEEPGKTIHTAIAQAKVPQGANKVLVILIPLAEPEGDLVFGAKVQNLAGFRGGDWLYLNLTDADIGIVLGTEKQIVKPGGLRIQSAPNLAEATNMVISYNYRPAEEKEWRLLTESTVVVMPSRREICIFSADPRSGRVGYHGITFPVE
jgi:hypothetical protein